MRVEISAEAEQDLEAIADHIPAMIPPAPSACSGSFVRNVSVCGLLATLSQLH
jgi:hypothetical protein